MVMKVIRKARNEGVRVERAIKMPLIHRPNGERQEGRTIMGAAFAVKVGGEKGEGQEKVAHTQVSFPCVDC